MTDHEYKPSLMFAGKCAVCFKLESEHIVRDTNVELVVEPELVVESAESEHEVVLDEPQITADLKDLTSKISPKAIYDGPARHSHSHFCPSCEKQFEHGIAYLDCELPPTAVCDNCRQMAALNPTVVGHKILHDMTKTIGAAKPATCDVCGNVLSAADLANPDDQTCRDCKQQAAAYKARHNSLAEIERDGKLLSGRDIAERQLNHGAFLALELQRLPEDKHIEFLTNHILDLKRKIEMFQADLMTSYKVRADKQCEEMTKLSPEEYAAYQRAAQRPPKQSGKKQESPEAEYKRKCEERAKLVAKTAKDLHVSEALADAMIPQIPKPAAPKETERAKPQSKREKIIESLVKQGIARAVAEKMTPEVH